MLKNEPAGNSDMQGSRRHMQSQFDRLSHRDQETIRRHPSYRAAFTANTSKRADDALKNLELLLLTRAFLLLEGHAYDETFLPSFLEMVERNPEPRKELDAALAHVVVRDDLAALEQNAARLTIK